MAMWTGADYFLRQLGSKVWPSTDLQDSPFDTFTCKVCGYTLRIQMYGSLPMGAPSFDERAETLLAAHVWSCHRDAIISREDGHVA